MGCSWFVSCVFWVGVSVVVAAWPVFSSNMVSSVVPSGSWVMCQFGWFMVGFLSLVGLCSELAGEESGCEVFLAFSGYFWGFVDGDVSV